MTERCHLLEWDSAFFGRRIARLDGENLHHDELAAINRWCASERIDCLYFLADTNCATTIAAAERGGFAFADFRVTYEWKSSLGARGIRPRIGERVNVRTHCESDAPRLVEIARSAHTDSRFFFDPHFGRERAALLFETWIRRALDADHVIVGESGGVPAGYLSCQRLNGGAGCIGLAAVDTRFHGQGIGRAMIEAALEWFAAHGVSDIRVVTQGRNVAAHRFYQSAGFLTRSVGGWYHKWFTEGSSP